jgi:hypothetical protein
MKTKIYYFPVTGIVEVRSDGTRKDAEKAARELIREAYTEIVSCSSNLYTCSKIKKLCFDKEKA